MSQSVQGSRGSYMAPVPYFVAHEEDHAALVSELAEVEHHLGIGIPRPASLSTSAEAKLTRRRAELKEQLAQIEGRKREAQMRQVKPAPAHVINVDACGRPRPARQPRSFTVSQEMENARCTLDKLAVASRLEPAFMPIKRPGS